MRFSIDESDARHLLEHLQGADADFVPPLSTRLDLLAYADKLVRRARRIEAWDSQTLVGCVAMYTDDVTQGGFISNVSVLPSHRGRGLAGQLLSRTLLLAVCLDLPRVRLEVQVQNEVALALYSRQGFRQVTPASGPTLFLERVL